MKPIAARKYVPDVSAEQHTLDRTRKHVRKLRWIGQEEEAERMLMVLGEERLRPPPPDERRNRIPSFDTAKHSIA